MEPQTSPGLPATLSTVEREFAETFDDSMPRLLPPQWGKAGDRGLRLDGPCPCKEHRNGAADLTRPPATLSTVEREFAKTFDDSMPRLLPPQWGEGGG